MTKRFLIPLCILGYLSPLYTAAAHGATVGYAAASCNLLVVGTVTTRTESSANVSFDIVVQRVLKGSAVSGPLHVSHPWNRGGIISGLPPIVTSAIDGIWCLQPGASTGWDVQVLNGPDGYIFDLYWPAAATVPAAYQVQGGGLADTLLFELAAGTEASGYNPEVAIGAAQGAQSSSLQLVAQRFMSSPIPEFQIAGLMGLLPTQPSMIGSVSGLWPSISNNPRRSLLVFAIRDAFRDPAPSSIQQLVQLASISPELREAAVRALAAIHTKESLPFLATLLTSPDAEERSMAVFGLSSFANVCPAETPANVQSMAYLQCANSGPYSNPSTVANSASPGMPSDQILAFWTNWWVQNQASLQ